MWPYLIFNSGWFALLLLIGFFGIRALRICTFLLILGVAAVLAATTSIDPFTWFFYVSFSCLVLWATFQFKGWAHSKLTALDEEIDLVSRRSEAEQAILGQKVRLTEAVENNAAEISYLYEKTKEMSQSRDILETFLIFGEALSKHFLFQAVKLAIFDEETLSSERPEETYTFYAADFQGLYDRNRFLKDRKKAMVQASSFDQKIFDVLFREGRSVNAVDLQSGSYIEHLKLWPDFEPFIAYPVFVNQKIFCVLILLGIQKKDISTISILIERFLSEVRRVKLYQKVENLAITDGLTGVYVRRHLMERLEGELERSRRLGLKLSFLMIDIDDFKRFNDQFGHLVGDVVLREVASTIKKNIREVDLVGRYGGEEFGVLLVETDESAAFFVAERIRLAVQEKQLLAYEETLQVTVSIGCVTISEKLDKTMLLVDAADAGLYEAKRQGKNRVSIHNLLNPRDL